jgi:rubrerythrin
MTKSAIHLRAVLQIGREMELLAASLYKRLAEDDDNLQRQKLFRFLEGEEIAHASLIDATLDSWPSLSGAPADGIVAEAEPMIREFVVEPPSSVSLLDHALDQEYRSIRFYEYFQDRMQQEFYQTQTTYRPKEDDRLAWKLKQLDGMIGQERSHIEKLTALKNNTEHL